MLAALQSRVSDLVSNINDNYINNTTGQITNNNINNSGRTQENRSLMQYSSEFSSEEEYEDDDDDEFGRHHHAISIVDNRVSAETTSSAGDTFKNITNQLGSVASNVGGSIATNVSQWRQNWFNNANTNTNAAAVAAANDTILPITTTTTTTTTTMTTAPKSATVTSESGESSGAIAYLSSWKDTANKQLDDVWVRMRPVEPVNEPKGWFDSVTSELDQYTTMSRTNRMYGFGITLGIGVLFIVIAMAFLPSILVAARAFGLFYTVGNCCLIASTFFLVGPMKQLGMMFEKDRLIPSVCFLSSLFLTLFAALVLKSALLVLILLVVQVISLAYYILSYIPFGQKIVGVFVSSISTAIRAMF